MRFPRLAAFLLAASVPCVCAAQQDTQKEVERYRQLLAEGNPADLFEAKGELMVLSLRIGETTWKPDGTA